MERERRLARQPVGKERLKVQLALTRADWPGGRGMSDADNLPAPVGPRSYLLR
jgi:hypothetical protein